MAETQFASAAEWLNFWLLEDRLGVNQQKVFNKYYHSFKKNFEKYIQHHYSSQIREAEDVISKLDKPSVLEIGCGCGTESIWLGIKGASVTGVDLQKDRLDVAQARLEYTRDILGFQVDVKFKMASVFEIDNSEKFDVIWMEQAFHHIEPRRAFIQKLSHLLKTGGQVIISEANAWNPLLQMQLFKQRGLETIKEYQDKAGVKHMYGNERILTAGSLSKQLQRAGFSVRSVRYYRISPNRPWADNLLELEPYIPNWLAPVYTHYNLVASLDH